MNERADYLLQTLEKIGAPLMTAVIETSQAAGPDTAQQNAQTIATMLAKTVQASIDLGQAMEINPVEAGDDSLRVALAGLSAPLVAGQMRKKGTPPEDMDIKAIITALQAVLTFSDNFTPNAANARRLENLEAVGQSVDTPQTALQYVGAFVPVVQAVSVFSFGQSEQKLIVDITNRIVQKAAQMRQSLIPDIKDDEARRAELALVRALAALYTACHKTQTQKAQTGGTDNATDKPSMETVWSAFDLQSTMLETLVKNLVPGGEKTQQAGGSSDGPAQTAPQAPPPAAPVQPPPVQEQPQQQTPPPAQPPLPPPAPPPAETPQTTTAQQTGGANPMAMFAKPQTETPPPPSTSPPPAEPPPAEPPPAAAPPPAQAQPPAAPPAESNSGEQQSGGPMSFFKKKEE